MKDTQLNAILKRNGLDKIERTDKDIFGNEVKGLKRDYHMSLAKNETKGVLYPSEYNLGAMDIAEHVEENRLNRLKSSEYYENIMPQVYEFLAHAEQEGLLKEEDWAGFDLKAAGEARRLQKSGTRVEMTPALLLLNFSEEMHVCQQTINAWIDTIVRRLKKRGSTHSFQQESDRWIMEEGRKQHVLTRAEENELSKCLDLKKRIAAFYKGQANLFQVGDSPLAEAIAFACLWKNVMDTQAGSVAALDKKEEERAVVAYQEKYKRDPRQIPGEMERIRREIPKTQMSRLSSVVTLFPIGTLQFFDLMENSKITAYKKPARDLAGYFVHPDITPERRQLAKSWEGKEIIIWNGKIVGTGFQHATEDYRQSGKEHVSERVFMEREGYEPEYVDYVCGKKYVRGSEAWVGGVQIGKVLYVRTQRKNGKDMNGVRIYMESVEQQTDVPKEMMDYIIENA